MNGHAISFSLREAGFPVHLLPEPVESGTFAGHTCSEWNGVLANTPVGAALGDLQCSVYSSMTNKTDAGRSFKCGMHVTRALCRGILDNLVSMMPLQKLLEAGVETLPTKPSHCQHAHITIKIYLEYQC